MLASKAPLDAPHEKAKLAGRDKKYSLSGIRSWKQLTKKDAKRDSAQIALEEKKIDDYSLTLTENFSIPN